MEEFNMPAGAHDGQHETGPIEIPPVDYTHDIAYADALQEVRGLLSEVTGVLMARFTGLFFDTPWTDPPTAVDVMADEIFRLREDARVLKLQRDYLARTARIHAKVVHVEYDPAGNTTEYDADKEAVELFGEPALYFVTGCGPTPTHCSLITKELKP